MVSRHPLPRLLYKSLPPFPPPFPSPTMTNAHERITLPPISSFDVSPSRKLHPYRQPSPSGSRRHPHINGSPSWDGSSSSSNPLRRDLEPPDDARYEPILLAPGAPYYSLDVPPSSPSYSRRSPSIRRSPSTYDALDYGATSARLRGKHSPYSEPAGLVASSERPTHSSPRPHSSSAALDRERRGPVVPQVSCSRFHRFAQRLTWAPSRYTPFHFAPPHSRPLRPHDPPPYVSSREQSPDSRESHSRSSSHSSPLVSTRSRPGTVPSPSLLAAAPPPATAVTITSAASPSTSASATRVPAHMTAFFNSTPGDAQDVPLSVLGSERGRASPVRKRKASEMLGTSASPGSDERGISPEPSENEAKKKYKKKMNVRHYRAQNKDAMTQLRDALPEHMRPPERQAKAYVTLSGMCFCFFFCPRITRD